MPQISLSSRITALILSIRPASNWQLGAILLMLALILVAQSVQFNAQARTVLHGGTSRTEYVNVPVIGRPYYPQQATVRQADRLVASYKLEAAEAIYQKILRQNPHHVGALNGLGKVAFYKTASSNQNYRNQYDALITEAIDRFESALRYQPGFVEAHTNLAAVYMDQHRMQEAKEEIYRALKLSPRNNQALIEKGEWLIRNHQSDEALPYLQKAIQLKRNNAEAHYYLAVAQIARDELDEALIHLNTALALQPNNANVHYQMARIYEKQGNGAAAIEHYKKALSFRPELHNPRIKLANIYEGRGDNQAAMVQLKNILAAGTGDWTVIDRAAKLSIQNNQPEQAVKLYRKWQQVHPEDKIETNNALSKAKTKLAIKKLRDDDLISKGEAHRYAEQAIQYQPNNFEARMIKIKLDNELGAIFPLHGKNSAMIDSTLAKTDYQPYQAYEKGELLLSRYQFREAEQAFRAARRAGEGKRTTMHFGQIFLTKGMPNLAEEAFQQVLNEVPGNAAARMGLAKALEAREESERLLEEAKVESGREASTEVIELLEHALKLNVKNAPAHYLLAQTYEKTQEYAEAADHYYAYQQLQILGANGGPISRKIEEMKHKAITAQETGE